MDIDSRFALRRHMMLGLPAAVALVSSGCASTAPRTAAPTPATAPAERPWTDRPVFSVIDVDIRDGKAFGEYAAGHTPTIAAVGGRFLVAGAMPKAIEGTWPAHRVVIHEWPNAQTFFSWYDSPAYAPWKKVRHGASTANVILVQGIASSPPSADVSPAFVIIDVDVRDGAAFGRYVQGHTPSLLAAGGSFLAAGGRIQVVEGTWNPKRVVLHRWPSIQAFDQWYESAAYRPWRDLRHSASSARVALVEGLSERQKTARKMP